MVAASRTGRRRRRRTGTRIVLRHWYASPIVYALVVVVLLGAALRVYAIGNNPLGFFADEASFGYNAYTVLKHGVDEHGESFPLLFRAFGEFKLPVYIYGIVPFVAIFDLTETAVRLATAAFGIGTIVGAYFLGKALFRSQIVGLLSALVLSVEPWHVHYSRTGLGDIIAYPLFLTLGVVFFLHGRDRPSPWWPISAVTLAAAFYTYRGGWVFMPPFLAILALLHWRELLRYWKTALLSAGLFLLLLAPLGQHLLSGSGDRLQQVGILSQEQRDERTIQETYLGYFSLRFLFEKGDDGAITRHYLPGHGQLYWLQAPFLLLGALALLLRPTRAGALVLAGILLYPWGGVLTDAGTISSRTIHGAVLFALLTGYGLVVAGSLLGHLRGEAGRWAVATLAGAMAVVGVYQVWSYASLYHSQYPALSSGYWGWQWGPQEVIPYFQTIQDDYDALFLDGMFNAPHIFISFYAPEVGCPKCHIGDTSSYEPDQRQLFALRPESMAPSYTYDVKRTLSYPDGTPAFRIVEITGKSDP